MIVHESITQLDLLLEVNAICAVASVRRHSTVREDMHVTTRASRPCDSPTRRHRCIANKCVVQTPYQIINSVILHYAGLFSPYKNVYEQFIQSIQFTSLIVEHFIQVQCRRKQDVSVYIRYFNLN